MPTKKPTNKNISMMSSVIYNNFRITHLEFPSTCKSHNIIRVVLLLYLTKPLQVITIHRLQWCSKQCVIDISRRILQVLPVPNPGLEQRCSRTTDSVSHELVCRWLGPTEIKVRWEDSEIAIWRVRGWFAMGEDVWLEWLKKISERQAVVVLAEPVAPELIESCYVRTNKCIDHAAVNKLLTLVSFMNAFIIGLV